MATFGTNLKVAWKRPMLMLATVGILMLGIAIAALYGPPWNLAHMERTVVWRWPGIAALPRTSLAQTMRGDANPSLVLFDVREADEYAVSHLPGAIRISPDISADDFLAAYGSALAGKTAVFYCAVGVRSALVIRDLETDLRLRGVASVYNLSGGIFGWHNDGRPLVDARGATDIVHGFAPRWARLVQRQSLVRMKPER